VPANGRLSAAIFALQAFSQRLVTIDSVALPTEAAALDTAVAALRAVLYTFLSTGVDTAGGLFASATAGIPDASLVAGVMIHAKFSVGDFMRTQPTDFSSNVALSNLLIRNLEVAGTEIGALKKTTVAGSPPSTGNPYIDNTVVADLVGAVFDVDFCTDQGTGAYVPNELADLQVTLADYINKCITLGAAGCTTAADATQAALMARNKIGESVVGWALSGSPATMTALKAAGGYTVVGNHDIMHHMSKGIVGLKLDGVGSATVDSVVVQGLTNTADGGRRSWLAVEQDPTYQFTGYATRGLSVASSVDVDVDQISVEDTAAAMVDTISVDALHDFKNVNFKNTQAGYDFEADDTAADDAIDKGSKTGDCTLANVAVAAAAGGGGVALIIAAAALAVFACLAYRREKHKGTTSAAVEDEPFLKATLENQLARKQVSKLDDAEEESTAVTRRLSKSPALPRHHVARKQVSKLDDVKEESTAVTSKARKKMGNDNRPRRPSQQLEEI